MAQAPYRFVPAQPVDPLHLNANFAAVANMAPIAALARLHAALNAAAAAGGGVIVLAPGAVIAPATVLDIPSNTTLALNGATLDFSAVASGAYLRAQGTASEVRELTANVATGGRTLNVSTSGLQVGQMLRLLSEAEFDPLRTASWLGEAVFIKEIVSGSELALKGALADSYATADLARVEPLGPVRGVRIVGPGRIVGNPTPLAADTAILIYRGIGCIVANGIVFDEIDHAHIVFRDCVDCHEHRNFHRLMRPNVTGYGVSFMDATQDCSATHSSYLECRHSLSTNNGASYGGVPRRITFESNVVRFSVPAGGGSMAGGDAIDTHSAAEDITIRNNRMFGSSNQGINVECPSAVVEGNEIEDTFSTGIGVHNETPRPGNIVVRNNTVRRTGGNGIRVTVANVADGAAYERLEVTGNQSEDTVEYGFRLTGASDRPTKNLKFIGNSAKNNGGTLSPIFLNWIENYVCIGNTSECAIAGQGGYRFDNSRYGSVMGNAAVLAPGSTAAGFDFRAPDGALDVATTVIGNSLRSPSAASSKGVTFVAGDVSGLTVRDNDFGEATTPVLNLNYILDTDGTIALHGDLGPISVDTFEAAASDNLDIINGGRDRQVLTLRPAVAGRAVVVRTRLSTGNVGNIIMSASDVALAGVDATLTLVYRAAADRWYEVGRGAKSFVNLTGDAMTGALQVPTGAVNAPGLAVGAANTGLYEDDGSLSFSLGGSEAARLTPTEGWVFGDVIVANRLGLTVRKPSASGSTGITFEGAGTVTASFRRSSPNSIPPTFGFVKSRGDVDSPESVHQNDQIGRIFFSAVGNSSNLMANLWCYVIAASPSDSDMEGRLVFDLAPPGSGTGQEILRLEHATGLSMFGANPTIDQNRHHRLRTYTVGTLPGASPAGQMIHVGDGDGNRQLAVSDGTDWRFPDGAIVS